LARPETLQVEVYNLAADVPIEKVHQTLEWILASSSIQLAWRLEDPRAPEGQLIVLVGNLKSREHAECAAKRSISLRIAAHAPVNNDCRELGFSLPFAPAGVNVVVYFDRVLVLSRETQVPVPILLAHAIAHEIGHVLLRTEEHTSGDLMADTWRAPEFARMRRRGLPFNHIQSIQIRNDLAGRRCTAESAGMASGNGDRTQCTASTLDEKSAIRRGASAALACRGRVTGKSKAIPKSVACAQVRRWVTGSRRSGSDLKNQLG